MGKSTGSPFQFGRLSKKEREDIEEKVDRSGYEDAMSQHTASKKDPELFGMRQQQALFEKAVQDKVVEKGGEGALGGADSEDRALASAGASMLVGDEGASGGAAQGAIMGSKFGVQGALIGGAIGGVAGGLQAKAATKARNKALQAKLEAEKAQKLGQIEQEKDAKIQRALQNMKQSFSKTLRSQRKVRL